MNKVVQSVKMLVADCGCLPLVRSAAPSSSQATCILHLLRATIIRSLRPSHKVHKARYLHTLVLDGPTAVCDACGIMDDPDVDHELIALLRESLGISNKAQDVVSTNTGKEHISLFVQFYASIDTILIALSTNSMTMLLHGLMTDP